MNVIHGISLHTSFALDCIATYFCCYVTSTLHRHFTSRMNLLNRNDHLHNWKKQLCNNRHILSRLLARLARIHICFN